MVTVHFNKLDESYETGIDDTAVGNDFTNYIPIVIYAIFQTFVNPSQRYPPTPSGYLIL